MIIGISGACRSDEIFKLNMQDLDILENKVTVVIPQTKNYTSRVFAITDVNWLAILRQYINMRMNLGNDRFFLQLRLGKITKQHVGHNSISQFPKRIAEYLNLNDAHTFTGHCFRRTAATLFANSGGDVLQLKRLGGWKSSAVAEGYVDQSSDGQLRIAKMLSSTINDCGQSSAKNCASTEVSTSSVESTSVQSNSTVTHSVASNSIKSINVENKPGLSVTINSSDHANATPMS